MESKAASGGSTVVTSQGNPVRGIRVENPFNLKVGQVFTGFGIGCGVGIGVGRPINIGAIPMMNQVMSATKGATDAFSGVSQYANNALRKLGAKNIKAGIGCGVGLGHGFGFGLSMKPGVAQKIQASLVQVMTKMMMNFGIVPDLSIGQISIPLSMQSGMSMVGEPSIQNQIGRITQMATKLPDNCSQGLDGFGNTTPASTYKKIASKETKVDTSLGRTEKVISNFLQDPAFSEDGTNLKEVAGQLLSENNMLQVVLKHQRVIEELREQNEKLRQILVEDLKIPPSKLQTSFSTTNKSACDDCFHCRRKQRKS
ncbi:uncharacterized protein LOC119981314 isoform X1 [Tripterygium wilfordii]|uniref:uncharacterized protein LOC119981314 isoform X1 n=2 Tax=Tripterygium wilfordii TaxID=458696 RepID=UPI0018F84D1B|nr:uncharacterized protein LOC119981314 isoform X1 [Tripterygium wilfordii]